MANKALVHSRARIGRLRLAVKLKTKLLTLIKIRCQAEFQQKSIFFTKADFRLASRPVFILFQRPGPGGGLGRWNHDWWSNFTAFHIGHDNGTFIPNLQTVQISLFSFDIHSSLCYWKVSVFHAGSDTGCSRRSGWTGGYAVGFLPDIGSNIL